MYTGQIASRGPRYCPSIEDKVVRFADKDQHQLFLEPEGRNTLEVYVNGISTSLPRDVQTPCLSGFLVWKRRPFFAMVMPSSTTTLPPDQLYPWLETSSFGLILCRPIEWNDGLRGSAGQGLIAGASAALALKAKKDYRSIATKPISASSLTISSHVAWTNPIACSPAEQNIDSCCVQDNADRRLTEKGRLAGLVDDHRWSLFEKKLEQLSIASKLLCSLRIGDVPAQIPKATRSRVVGDDPPISELGHLQTTSQNNFVSTANTPAISFVKKNRSSDSNA